MEITIVTGLFTKRNMEVDATHGQYTVAVFSLQTKLFVN